MITTTSSSNIGGRLNGLFFSIIRRYIGVTILYFILQFIFFPLQYILTASNALKMIREGGPDNYSNYQHFFGFNGIHNGVSVCMIIFMVITIPVLFTLMQFSYLHQKRATDMYHSLPVRREKLLFSNFGASMTMFGLPLTLNYLITIIAGFAFGFKEFSALGATLELLFHLTMAASIISITLFVCVLSGTIFDSFIYTVGTLYALPLILAIIFLNASHTLVGFVVPEWTRYITYLSPGVLPVYIQAFHWNTDDLLSTAYLQVLVGAILWLILTAIILYSATIYYRRRKSELAGKTGFDTPLTIFIKLAGTFAGAFFFSILIEVTTTSNNVILLTISALAGGALTYCIIECILARGFKTLKKSFPKIVAGMVLPAIFVLVFGTGGFGYETRVPDAEKVQQVTMTFNDRYLIPRYDLDEAQKQIATRAAFNRYSPYIQDVQLDQAVSLKAVTDLHRQIIMTIDDEPKQLMHSEFIPTYTLNSGMKQSRRYYTFSQSAREAYNRLNALQEVKEQTHPIYSFNAPDIQEVTLLNISMTSITPATLNEQEIQQIVEAIREDMTSETYEQMISAKPLGYIVLTPKYDANDYHDWMQSLISEMPSNNAGFFDCYVLLTEAYSNTVSLLQSFGYPNFSEFDPTTIQKAYVRLDESGGNSGSLRINGPSGFIFKDYLKADEELSRRYFGEVDQEITDPSVIQILYTLVDPYNRNTVAPIQFEQESGMRRYWGGDGVTITFCFVSENGMYQTFHANPQKVPQNLLYQLQDGFNTRWKESRWAVPVEEPFEEVMKAIQRANGEFPMSSSNTFVDEAAAYAN